MKKLWSVLLCAGLVLGLWGCSDEPVKGAVTQPPGLAIACGEASIAALGGGYDWRYQLRNGETANTIADAAHPLEESLDLPVLEAETGEAALTWDGPAPDLVRVVAWPAASKGSTEAHSTLLELLGDTLPLQAGEWIYRVKGSWSAQEEWGGIAEYVFTVNAPVVYQEPPALTLVQGEGRVAPFTTFLYWECAGVGTNRSLSVPSGWEVPSVQAGVPVTLEWEAEPDEVTLQRWPQGVPDEEAQGEELPWEGSLTPEAGWVYVFYAGWEVQNGWGGTGVYAFCAGE